MVREINPFKVGQVVEAKTFEEGFRGAWFRGKIQTINEKKGRLGHILEYLDFPEEELKWTMLYQATFSIESTGRRKHKELMLRPHYPPIYYEKQRPHVSEISEVTAIVADSWRVGDLVDWWNCESFWSGRITQLLDDNKAQVELKPPPLGEGKSYEALLKDLRPSLDWSLELGWTVPTQEGDTGRPCAHLLKPTNQVIDILIRAEDSPNAGQETEDVQRPAGSSARSLLSSPVPSNSDVSDNARSRTITGVQKRSLGETVSKKQKEKHDRSRSLGPVDRSTRVADWAVADSGQNRVDPAARSLLSSPVPSNSDVSDKARSRTITGMHKRSLGETVSKKQKEKQDRSRSLGPVDRNTRIAARAVADSGQVDPAARSLLSSPVPSNSDVSAKARSRIITGTQTRSLGEAVSKKQKEKQDRSNNLGPVDSSTRITDPAVGDSGQNRVEPAADVAKDKLTPDTSQKRYRHVLHSERSNTLEAVIFDLEESLNKVKWLKKILENGTSASNAQEPQWQFVEQLAALVIPK